MLNHFKNFTTAAVLALVPLGLSVNEIAHAQTTNTPITHTAYRNQNPQILPTTETTLSDQQAKAKGLINMLKASQGEAFHQQVIHMLNSVGPEALAELKIMYGQKEWRSLVIATLGKMQTPGAKELLQALNNSTTPTLSTNDSKQKVAAMMHLAASQTETFNYEAAIQTYSQVLEIDSDNAKAHGNRGILHLHVGEHQAAVSDFQHSAKLYKVKGNMAQHSMAMNYVRTVNAQIANLESTTSETSLLQK